jgi:peptide subunit release factor 1 (eRF1)
MRPAQTTARKAAQPKPRRGDLAPNAATIERIEHFHGGGLRVVSTYLATTAGSDARRALRTKADSLLHEIRSLGDDRSLDHAVRMSLRGDMARIDAVLDSEPISHGTLVIFSCTGADLFEAIRLPRAIRDRIVVDATAWIRPLLAVLDEYRRCCTVVVDRESAHLWELYLGELRDAGRLRGRALRDPAHGGWHGLSEHGVRNKADELAKRHFREVAAALDRRFREDRYDLLAVGGHEHELPVFLELLPRSLRERVADTFTVDPHTAAPATIRAHAEAALERYELDEQRRWVADVLAAVAAGGPAVAGLEPCLRAGSMTAVSTL